MIVETAIQQISYNMPVDPLVTLKQLRQQRPHMVQTDQQFHFANKAILQWYDKYFNK